jgi:hypothetical protein
MCAIYLKIAGKRTRWNKHNNNNNGDSGGADGSGSSGSSLSGLWSAKVNAVIQNETLPFM